MGRVSSCWWVWLRLCSLFVWVVCFENVPRAFKRSDGNICIKWNWKQRNRNCQHSNYEPSNMSTECKGCKTEIDGKEGNLGVSSRMAAFSSEHAGSKKHQVLIPFGITRFMANWGPFPQYPCHYEALSGQRVKFWGTLSFMSGNEYIHFSLLPIMFPSRPKGPCSMECWTRGERGRKIMLVP